jgi:CheY-like chemotaxis protein/DNA-directed RNA polymerase specialized sigma24 family protein
MKFMGLSSKIALIIPCLRRFARALTGSQESGDQYVAALLEAIITDPRQLEKASEHKIALYAGLCRLWNSVSVNVLPDVSVPSWEATIQDRLASIPGMARQVYLLQALEEFQRSEIAEILGLSVPEVEALSQQANSEISEMITSNVLIIEDEPLIAMDIEGIVKSLGHTSLGVARTRSEALKVAQRRPPQLVLSDILLADGSSGIDAVNDILRDFNVPVIFITAFPERLLTGEKPEPAFLITKPFSENIVKAVIAQALFFNAKSKQSA